MSSKLTEEDNDRHINEANHDTCFTCVTVGQNI